MLPNLQNTMDMVTFTEEIFNGKLHFLCSGLYAHMQRPTAKNDKNCDVPLRKHLHVSIKSQARYVSRIPE